MVRYKELYKDAMKMVAKLQANSIDMSRISNQNRLCFDSRFGWEWGEENGRLVVWKENKDNEPDCPNCDGGE